MILCTASLLHFSRNFPWLTSQNLPKGCDFYFYLFSFLLGLLNFFKQQIYTSSCRKETSEGKREREREREGKDHEKRKRRSCNSLKKTDNTCCCTAAEPEPKIKKDKKFYLKENSTQYPYTTLISSTTKSPKPNCLPLTFVSSLFPCSQIRQRCHHFPSFIIRNQNKK